MKRLRLLNVPGTVAPPSCRSCTTCCDGELQGLVEADVARLERIPFAREYRVGEVLFHQNEPVVGVYAIRSGLIGLRRFLPDGRSMILRVHGAGTICGIASLVANVPHPVTAEVLESAEVCFLEARQMRALIEDSDNVRRCILQTFARSAIDTVDDATAMLLPVRARIARLLLRLRFDHAVVGQDGALHYRLPFSRQQLAAMTGATPESISRATRELTADEVAQFRGRWVTVPDLDQLIDETEPRGGD